MVMTTGGVVASEHPLASQAGASVLARGGHAVDAAIAANAVMGVVAPMMNGIGGDLFAIVHDAATGDAARPQRQRTRARGAHDRRAARPRHHAHAADRHPLGHGPGRRGGVVDAERALRPSAARRRARAGDPHGGRGCPGRGDHRRRVGGLARRSCAPTAEAARVLPARRPAAARRRGVPQSRPRGQLPADWPAGGRDAFYAGDDRAAHRSPAPRGTAARWRPADLAEYDAEWVAPLSTTYRGWTVYELPPNGQGIAALMMLNLLERFPIGALRAQLGRGAAHADRGEEAGLCRHGAAPGRPGLPRGAGRGAAVEGVRRLPRARDRSVARAPGRRAGHACRRAAATRPT